MHADISSSDEARTHAHIVVRVPWAFDASNVALASVTCEVNTVHKENNSDRNTANNFANSNTENNQNANKQNDFSQSVVSLSQYPAYYSHANMTASDMFSNYVPGPSGFPVPVGPGPVTTWSTNTHRVHREMTSSYPPLGIFGPGPSRPGNPFIDADSRCGPPPSAYYYGMPSAASAGLPFPVPTYPIAKSMGNAEL